MRKTVLLQGLAVGLMLSGCGETSRSPAEKSSGTEVTVKTPAAPAKAKVGDGPFGLDLSADPASLDIDKDNSEPGEGIYTLKSVPAPHGSFESYFVLAFPGVGLCSITAVSLDNENDPTGSKVVSVVDAIKEALESKYGTPQKFDFCSAYSCDTRFWTSQIDDKTRTYAYRWKADKTSLSTGMREIFLQAVASDMITTYARLHYVTGDEKTCDAARNKAKASNL